MKHAISNIALPQYRHGSELRDLRALGLAGLEVAPSRVWPDTWRGLTPQDVETYRADVEIAGLEIVGLHSLLFDQPDLALCAGAETRGRLLEFFVHLSGLCRDLGGRTLIWGGGRKRGETPEAEAMAIAVEFFGNLADRTADHGTIFCLEPLTPADTDFVHSVRECQHIAQVVNRRGLKVQIDAKALAGNGELDEETFRAVAADLVHVHANEPGFDVLGASGTVDHAAAGKYLRNIGYDGYVSIEQRMIDAENPLAAVRKSVSVLREAYA